MKRGIRMDSRRGASAVEFALIAPIFFLVVLGIVEFGRSMMVQQTLINASREGARRAIFEDATTDKAKDAVESHMASAGITIPRNQITVSPNPATATTGDAITVGVSMAYDDIAWIPGFFMGGRTLSASTTMSYESTD